MADGKASGARHRRGERHRPRGGAATERRGDGGPGRRPGAGPERSGNAAPGRPHRRPRPTRAPWPPRSPRFGRLDLVVANAGIQHVAPVEEFPIERFETIVALLLTSPFVLAKYAWPHLREAGRGRFIAIASAHGSRRLAVTSRPTCRPSTASWGWSRPWPWRAPSTASLRPPSAPGTSAPRWSRSRSPIRPAPTGWRRSACWRR